MNQIFNEIEDDLKQDKFINFYKKYKLIIIIFLSLLSAFFARNRDLGLCFIHNSYQVINKLFVAPSNDIPQFCKSRNVVVLCKFKHLVIGRANQSIILANVRTNFEHVGISSWCHHWVLAANVGLLAYFDRLTSLLARRASFDGRSRCWCNHGCG